MQIPFFQRWLFDFEPGKLVSLALALLLLSPFAYLFWQMIKHQRKPEAERIAEMRAHLKETAALPPQAGPPPEGEIVVERLSRVVLVEQLPLFNGAASWWGFYPRRWLGFVGLTAVGTMTFCLVLAFFFPGPNAVTVDTFEAAPPQTETK